MAVLEVETIVNVWTVHQKNGRCREVAVGGVSTVLNECNKMGRTSRADFANFQLSQEMRISLFTIKHETKVNKEYWF